MLHRSYTKFEVAEVACKSQVRKDLPLGVRCLASCGCSALADLMALVSPRGGAPSAGAVCCGHAGFADSLRLLPWLVQEDAKDSTEPLVCVNSLLLKLVLYSQRIDTRAISFYIEDIFSERFSL